MPTHPKAHSSRNSSTPSATAIPFSVPAPADFGPGWNIGGGFDPVTGKNMNRLGIDTSSVTIQTDADIGALGDSSTVSSASQVSASVSMTEAASAGAFGTSASESMSAQTAASASESTIVMQYWQIGTLKFQSFEDLDTAQLTSDAATMLANEEFETFCETYGTYFIQGFTTGIGLYLNYSMTFTSVAAQASFSEKMGESTPVEKASESISVAAQASNTTYKDEYPFAQYGHEPKPAWVGPDGIDNIQKIANNFNSAFDLAKTDDTIGVPVTVWVVPWAALPAVQEILTASATSVDNNYKQMLSIYMDLTYVATTAGDMADESTETPLFVGGSQLAAMQSLSQTAHTNAEQVQTLLDTANTSGQDISDDTVTTWQNTRESLMDTLQNDSQNITLNWSAYLMGAEKDPAVIATALIPNTDGKMPVPSASSSGYNELSGSCYLQWPQGSEITKDCVLCEWNQPDGGTNNGNIVCSLNRTDMSIQVFYNSNGNELDAGEVIVVAGSTNTLSAYSAPADEVSKAAYPGYTYLYGQATVG